MAIEREHLWPQVWMMAGLERDVAKPGDYFVFDHGDESILVARDLDGKLGAFHNVCLHRGHLLREAASRGNCSSFLCPYHHWDWGLDGALCNVPYRPRFPQGFPESRLRLSTVACQAWAGLVWVCLGEPRESLEEFLGPVHEHLARYRMQDFVVRDDRTGQWEVNWKTAIDGFTETYHVPATHPQFLDFVDPLEASSFQYGSRHSLLFIKLGARPPSATSSDIKEPLAGMVRRAGHDPAKFQGRVDEARALVQRFVREQGERDGHDFSSFLDEQLIDSHQFYVFPNLHVDFHGVNDVTIYRYRPHRSDPGCSYFDNIDLHRPPRGHSPPRLATELLPPGKESQMGVIIDQDLDKLRSVQRGMRTRGFTDGPHVSLMERRVTYMHEIIDEVIGDAVPPALRVTSSPAV